MISAARAKILLARYQQDFLSMQDDIDGGMRSDRQILPELIRALESIAYSRPYKLEMTGMTSIKINSSNPQQAIPALLNYLDKRFLDTHLNERGGRK